jgi:hypothetical protein
MLFSSPEESDVAAHDRYVDVGVFTTLTHG